MNMYINMCILIIMYMSMSFTAIDYNNTISLMFLELWTLYIYMISKSKHTPRPYDQFITVLSLWAGTDQSNKTPTPSLELEGQSLSTSLSLNPR